MVSERPADFRRYLGAALLVAFTAVLLFQLPRLADDYIVEEDFRNLYWLHRFNDPDLFQDDPLIQQQLLEFNFGERLFVYSKYSPGYGFLFQIGTIFFSPALFSKLLALPLILISVYYLFHIAAAMGTPRQAFFVCLAFVILNLMLSTDLSVVAGLQRSFTMPILLAMINYLMTKEDIKAALVALTGIIYPPLFVLNGLAYGLSLVSWRGPKKLQIAWQRIPPIAVAAILGLLLLLPAFVVQAGDETVINQTSSAEIHILQDPAFGRDGRFALFETLFFGDGGLYNFNLTGLATTAMLLLSCAIWLLLRGDRIPLPPALWTMFYASMLAFIISWLGIIFTSSMALYIPNRYSRGILYLNSFLFVAFNVGPAARQLALLLNRQQRRQRPWLLLIPVFLIGLLAVWFSARQTGTAGGSNIIPWLLAGLVGLLLLLMFTASRRKGAASNAPAENSRPASKRGLIILGAIPAIVLVGFGFTFKAQFHEFHEPTADERALYAFIESLPPESLLAGYPCALDSVPMYTKHKVLYNCEIPNPDFNFMLTALATYYASDQAALRDFCAESQATHLVVDLAAFSDENVQTGAVYFEPYDSLLSPTIAGRSEFALTEIDAADKLFQAGSLFVLSCANI